MQALRASIARTDSATDIANRIANAYGDVWSCSGGGSLFDNGNGTATYYTGGGTVSGGSGSGGGGGSGGFIYGSDPSGAACADAGYDPATLNQSFVFDREAFAIRLRQNAHSASTGMCARYVRQALCQSNGIACGGGPNARDYGPFLVRLGFQPIISGSGTALPAGYTPMLGDVAVFDYLPYGHVCAWDGQNWTSDFIQNTIQPSQANPSRTFTIYRKP